jgi:hypothetical protein
MTNFVGIPMKRQMIITQTNNIRRSPFNELIKDNRPMLSHFLQKKEKREKRARERREREREEKETEKSEREREERASALPAFAALYRSGEKSISSESPPFHSDPLSTLVNVTKVLHIITSKNFLIAPLFIAAEYS